MCIKNCFNTFIETEKRGAENICRFFKKERTPLENGLLVAAGLLGGIVLGFACCPSRSIQVGSCNGCENYIERDFGTKKPVEPRHSRHFSK